MQGIFSRRRFLFLTTALFVVSAFFVPVIANAAISTITITAPMAGNEWRGTQNITWSALGAIPGDLIDIVYTNDGFANTLVMGQVSAVAGNFSWDTSLLTDATTYQVKLYDHATPAVNTVSGVFTIDNTAPTTTYTPSIAPDGLAGWYITTPTMTLTCGDGSGSGCNKTYYQWDGVTGSWIDNSITPLTAIEGDHTLYYYSDDNATDSLGVRNIEIVKTQNIKVDTIFPTVAVTSTTTNGSYNVPDAINVTLTFSEPVSSTDTIKVTLDTLGSCTTPVITSATTAICTYIVGAGENSLDLTSSSISPTSGVVEDVAGNDANLSPTSNIADTSNIIIDTTSPIPFTVGTVVTTGGTVVPGWWNSTNTGIDIDIPVDNDNSLVGGTIQLQAEADGTYENVGAPYAILLLDINSIKTLSLTDTQIEALAGFSDADNLQFRAIITDLAENTTTGTQSANNFNVDQTLPSVDAGIDEEVNAIVLQDATVSDGGAGIFSYLWTADNATVSFGTASAEDTNISAGIDGIYVATLTVADNAGNVNSDTIQFAWDTAKPVITEIIPVSTPTNNTAPEYQFSVDSVRQLSASTGGTITYGGACGNADILTADAGINTIRYGTVTPLVDATYSDCTIVVTDAAGNSNVAFTISSFEVDTIAALVVSSETYDTDLDGRIDKTIITFDDELSDATIVTSQFTIGGVNVTGYLTGAISNDAIIEFTVAGGVAGTEAKSVAYAEGTVTDLAGNTIAFYSQTSTDLAGPIMLSAITKTTTSIDTTWSEDLDGGTVNPSGNEFVVTGYSVSAASETSAGVVTLTVAVMPTDATPLITFTSTLFRDLNGQDAPSPQTKTATDGVAPVLTAVSIISNNALDTTLAKAGDTITLTFTSSEAIATPTVLIAGVSAGLVTSVGNDWTATRIMAGTDTQGPVAISIDFTDTPAGNAGATITAVTDGSAVFFDSVNPSVNAGTDKEVNTVINQDATVSDPAPSSVILSYLWTNETPTIGTITFGTASAEDTTILADADGIYTIRLTVSDKAGNIAFDEITFIWDTTRPEPLTASPSNGSIGISVASGTSRVTFDEPVVLLDSSRILFVDDVTGTSYKGTVTVNGSNPAMLDIPYSALSYGTKYRINVKPNAVSDVATNKLSSNFISYLTTEIDKVAPIINLSNASGITTTGATLNVTTDENATCRYALTDSAYSTMSAFSTTNSTTHSVVVSGLTPSTGYDYYVRCADTTAQANEMTNSAHISFTTLTPDTTAPVITNIQANASDTGAIITWATDENATSRVEYGLTSGYGSFTATDTIADLTSHSVVISGLATGMTYHFRVLSNDISLNAGVSGDNTFSTADTTAPATPVITTSSATTDADTYALAGTITNDGGNRTITVYNGATIAGTTIVPTGSTSWTLLVQLNQETANVFTATSSDALGNTSAPSSSVTITEAPATGDVTDPAIPVITTAVATVDANEYTISGTAGADAPSDGTRTITIYNNGVVMGSIVLLTGETDWSFVASLSQNIPNTFTAYSTDESGNTSDESNSVVITELSIADTTVPATPVITTSPATVDADEYTISGTAGADAPSDGTRTITIYRNTVTTVVGSITLLSGQTAWSFVAPLAQNSANTFTAVSTDEVGNNSVASNAVTITEVTSEVTSVAVTNVSAVKTYATVGGDYASGWEWTFNVTVPTAETELQMKFDDWTTSLPNTISAAGNIRYSSVQASNGPFEIVTAGTYGSALHLTSDLDSEKPGRQIQIKVEARIPTGSSGGSYTTSYGIQSLPLAD